MITASVILFFVAFVVVLYVVISNSIVKGRKSDRRKDFEGEQNRFARRKFEGSSYNIRRR
jgi:hypothetical protein